MKNEKRIQSIDRAVDILNCFTSSKKELKLSEISDSLDLNKSTAHGILNTLKHHGLINQNPENQKYSLGLYLVTLGERTLKSIDIIEISRPYLVSIANGIGETAHLGILEGLKVIYIDKIESNESIRIVSSIGETNPACATGIGKVMLAYQNKPQVLEEIPDHLESYSPFTITSKVELLKEFEKIRNSGFGIDNQELNIGVTCVAVPIFDHFGEAKYAISISGPTMRMDKEKVDRALVLLKEAAKQISDRLGK